MATSLRELLIDIKVKIDRSGIKASDSALKDATTSASTLEKALQRVAAVHDKISAAQKRLQASNAANDSAFAKITGLNSRAGIAPKAPRPGGIGSMAAPDIFAPAPKALSALEALRERGKAAFNAINQRMQAASAQVDVFASKIFNARTAVAGFAAVIVAREIGQFIGDVIQTGKSLAEMSARTRVSVEDLQGWRALIAKVGVDNGVLETSFRKLSKASRAATKETSPQAKAFADLGVSVKNADGSLRPITEIMVDTGSALADMADDTKASAIATQLLGPAGLALVPAFEAGGDAVKKFLAVAKGNVSISTEEAKGLKKVGDSVERSGVKWTGLKNKLVEALLPVLTFVIEKFESFSTWLFDLSKHTKIFQAALDLLTVGALWKAGMMLAGWVTSVGGARAALSLLGEGLMTAAGFALKFIAPLLILEDFLVFLAGGKSLFGRAMNEIFGDGGAKQKREQILHFFHETKELIGQITGALSGMGAGDLFSGIAKAGLDAILVVLNLIGVALASDTDKANKLKDALAVHKEKLAKDLGTVIGHKVDDARPNFEKGSQNGNTSWVESVPGFNYLRNKVQSDPRAQADYNLNNGRAGVLPPAALFSSPNPAARNVTLTDNRTIEVNVTGGGKPGETGRATASAVNETLQTDARQTLSSVSE